MITAIEEELLEYIEETSLSILRYPGMKEISRSRNASLYNSVRFYLSYKLTDIATIEISRYYSVDNSTVHYYIKKAKDMRNNYAYDKAIKEIELKSLKFIDDKDYYKELYFQKIYKHE